MDTNKRHCKVCKVLKNRTEIGKWTESGKDKKFVDETGKTWNGNICPSCHVEIVKLKLREKRKLA